MGRENRTPADVRLETARTIVRLATEADAGAIVRYYSEHLEPFDPERPATFYDERFWSRQVQQNLKDYLADRSLRLFIFPADRTDPVIGNIGFANFVRGAGQYCTIGYSIAADYEGRGLMSEALRATITYAFDSLHLHRIEANYVPHNRRSSALLRRLGFVVEGYSRDYLRISGKWEDHIRTALVNPRWRE